jgi:hypothetical protein
MGRGLRAKSLDLMVKVGILLFVSLIMLAACELVVRAFVTVRNVGPSFTMYSSVYGKRLWPSISVTRITPEFTMRLSTNAQGFRQPDVVPLGSHPVLFLGNSFTMGYGVDDGDDFVALIRKAQPRTNGPFLNAGMGDNGNGRWLKFLTLEAPRYAPRLVVLQVMENDFEDNLVEGLFVLRDRNLIEQPIPPPGPGRRIMEVVPQLAYLHVVGLLRQVRWPAWKGGADRDIPDRSEHLDELTYRLIERALQLCQDQGWPLLGLNVGIGGERLERMRQFFEKHGVRLLDAPGRETHPELYYGIDGHWNADGHAYVARMLMEALPR